MSLENDIEKGRFASEREMALINLVYTSNFLLNKANKVLKQHDLSHQQFTVLRVLRDHHLESVTINMIKKYMLDQMSDVSRIVNRLQQKSYISRTKGLDDKREVRVRITRTGIDITKVIERELDDFTAILDQLSGQEIKNLNILLNKIRKKG